MFLFLLACQDKQADTAEEAATFAEVEAQVLGVSCAFSSCHSIGVGNLTLDGENDYDRLVNVPSAQIPELMLVLPGDPDSSYLMMKIEGTDGIVGGQMPSEVGLSAEQTQLLRSWISNGAQDD